MKRLLFLSALFFPWILTAQETVYISSLDGLTITCDFYHISYKKPVIILCHQAGYSRGEYRETAKLLNEWGFNCVALDQRSGNEVNGVENETAKRAREKRLSTTYLDAEQDILAVMQYVSDIYQKNIILFGSSYSASLALKIASEHQVVQAVIAFSPGEYFGKALSVRDVAKYVHCPAFITCAKNEVKSVQPIYEAIASPKKTFFVPESEGIHGSRALWEGSPGYEEYRKALKDFLDSL